jgi:hypothetical protein
MRILKSFNPYHFEYKTIIIIFEFQIIIEWNKAILFVINYKKSVKRKIRFMRIKTLKI